MHSRFYTIYEDNKHVKITETIPTDGKYKETRYSYKDRSNIHSYTFNLRVSKDSNIARFYIIKSAERVSIPSVKEFYDIYYKYNFEFVFPEDKFFYTTMIAFVKRWLNENGYEDVNKLEWIN